MDGSKSSSGVSVVIPCYRCADSIQRAIDSIIAQTVKPTEVILVDDSSEDGTLDTLREIARKNENWIRVIALKRNAGPGSARNAGWAIATQSFVAFLDADDAWHIKKIEWQLGFMEAHPNASVCVHRHREIGGPLSPLNWPLPIGGSKRLTKPRILLKNSYITPSIMVRSGLSIRFRSDQRYMEDQYFLYEVVCDGHRIDELKLELAAIYKPAFGAAGLSANLWAMERGELGNYRRLLQTGRLGLINTCLLMLVSLIKFARRLFQVKVWRKIASA
jgi:glycosyltransferase involved in cell wall biosynthesis